MIIISYTFLGGVSERQGGGIARRKFRWCCCCWCCCCIFHCCCCCLLLLLLLDRCWLLRSHFTLPGDSTHTQEQVSVVIYLRLLCTSTLTSSTTQLLVVPFFLTNTYFWWWWWWWWWSRWKRWTTSRWYCSRDVPTWLYSSFFFVVSSNTEWNESGASGRQ